MKDKITSTELARAHDLTVAEIEQWMKEFVSMGTEALRSHQRDAEAIHKAKRELLAKNRDLTMQAEAYKISDQISENPLLDVNS